MTITTYGKVLFIVVKVVRSFEFRVPMFKEGSKGKVMVKDR
jgi:hypothetical protein